MGKIKGWGALAQGHGNIFVRSKSYPNAEPMTYRVFGQSDLAIKRHLHKLEKKHNLKKDDLYY